MTCASPTLPAAARAASAAGVAPARPADRTPARRSDVYLLASVTLTFLAGSSAPTPLYPVYQHLWGFSSAMLTAVFASYVLVLLAALLVFGRLSDHVGRKAPILAALALQVVAMVLLGTAQDVAALFAGRVVQGLATGAALGAIGAGMLDLDRARGTIANAVAPGLGTAVGGLLSGLLVHGLPAPTHLVYAVLATLYVLQGIAVARMREPGRRSPGAWASLRPQVGTPPATRAPLRIAIPMLVAGWALAGFYASLGPGLVQRVFGFDASLGGGVALFLLTGSAGAAVLLLRALPARRLTQVGAMALSLGAAGVLWALVVHSAAAFVLGTAVAGFGFGAGFQGSVRSVLESAAATERAAVLSVLFMVSYVAMGLPALVAGTVAAHGGALQAVALAFGGFILALGLLAWRATASTTSRNPDVLRVLE